MPPSVSLSKLIILSQLFCLILSLNNKGKSYSTSISSMANLLEIEVGLINSVEKFAADLQTKVDALKNLIKELKHENQKSLNKREEYLYNPLNGFSLIRRLYYDWPKIEMFMLKPVGQDHLSTLRMNETEMPTKSDIIEASAAIYRLQNVYDLHVDDLVRGIINGKQYDANMKALDSYFMGSYMMTNKLYYMASLWLNHSVNSFEKDNDRHKMMGFGKEQPLKLYAEALRLQNRPNEALRYITQASDLKPLNPHLLNRKNEIQILANTRNDSALQMPSPVLTDYELGCRGHFIDRTSKMFCVYNTNTTSFSRLAPLKMEILNLDPYIVIYHDVLSDQEIEHLKFLARPKLIRAGVYDESIDGPAIDEDRTSHYSWFTDDADDVIKRINERIIDMTGLDPFHSELMQIGNYGMAGHYYVHYDFFNVSVDSEGVAGFGDRLSTLLFYLSDVEQGGATVFPIIKLAMFPRKGSALFWYNLNNKMEADERTLHAACPVIVGSKWVATKWIRANAQTFIKPCYE